MNNYWNEEERQLPTADITARPRPANSNSSMPNLIDNTPMVRAVVSERSA